MKRRDFLKSSIGGTMASTMLHGVPVQSMANSKLLQILSDEDCEDKVLVLVQLNGGNDGLNTVIPLNQYDKLQAARANLVLPENDLTPLLGQDSLAFHKKMEGLKNLYSDGKVAVVQNVGYPDQNFSHFRSTDIWLTASDEDVVLNSGWIGRTMDEKHPNFPENYPNTDYPDPIGIQTGVFLSPIFLGAEDTFGYAIDNPDNFYQLIEDTDNTPTDTPYGHELSFLRQTSRQSNAYSQNIVDAAERQGNLSTKYPESGNRLSDQLRIVSRMIGGGLKTKVYLVSLGGFDTHADQVEEGDHNEGAHGELLRQVSEALTAFQDDIELMGVSNRVLTMTFSEFGRRIASNGSVGTDHGAAAPMFLMSSGIEGQVIGNNPTIPDNVAVADNLDMELDFRSVYATVLRDWFCLPEDKIREILFGDFDLIPFTSNSVRNHNSQLARIKVFPNPTKDDLFLESELHSFKAEIFDAVGLKQLSAHLNGNSPLKKLNISSLKSGKYHLRISNASGSRVMPIVKL